MERARSSAIRVIRCWSVTLVAVVRDVRKALSGGRAGRLPRHPRGSARAQSFERLQCLSALRPTVGRPGVCRGPSAASAIRLSWPKSSQTTRSVRSCRSRRCRGRRTDGWSSDRRTPGSALYARAHCLLRRTGGGGIPVAQARRFSTTDAKLRRSIKTPRQYRQYRTAWVSSSMAEARGLPTQRRNGLPTAPQESGCRRPPSFPENGTSRSSGRKSSRGTP